MIALLNAQSESWLALVWAIVWQSTLLAVAVALGARWLRQAPPAVRFWLWQVVAIKLVLMPFWSVSLTLPSFVPALSSTNEAPAPLPSPSSHAPGLELPFWLDGSDASPSGDLSDDPPPQTATLVSEITGTSWLMLAWLAVVVIGLANLVRQRFRLSRLLRESRPLDDPEWIARVEQAATALGLKRAPCTLVTRHDGSPFVCGLVRPTLVLPQTLLDTLEPLPARQVLLHELAHIKRLDLVWGWVPEIARLVYWFHPVAHWAAFRVQLERELACDQLAMTHSGLDPARYAQTLVQVVAHASTPSVFKTAASAASLGGNAPILRPLNPSPDNHSQEPSS